MSDKVRVRYAPSPTGYLHVGGARTLLFNWFYAKRHGGKLILRIEDTDQQRSTKEHEKMILSDIARLGLTCDEGPEQGGPHVPYRQSERLDIYGKYAKQLLDEGKVYYCFCSEELLTQKREAAMKLGKTPHYDGTCARVSLEDAKKRLASGEKAGLRFRALPKTMILEDEVRGKIEFKEGMVGDFFITRTPQPHEKEIAHGIGMPVYNFCCVIDDYLMNITHIIRGEDHLSNAARQLMIYEALGWKPPKLIHTAMVLGADRQKLSKRNGDTSVFDYLDKGYAPEALLNFLALLGWWPPQDLKPKSGHPEVLSLEEMVSVFGPEGLQKAPAAFDLQKLQWMNGFYIKHLPLEEVCKRARPFFEKEGKKLDEQTFPKMVDAIRGEVSLFSELPKAAELFFADIESLGDEAKKAFSDPLANSVVTSFLKGLETNQGDLTDVEIKSLEKQVSQETGAKGKSLFMAIRVATTGKTHGPELKLVLPILGRERVINRIKSAQKFL